EVGGATPSAQPAVLSFFGIRRTIPALQETSLGAVLGHQREPRVPDGTRTSIRASPQDRGQHYAIQAGSTAIEVEADSPRTLLSERDSVLAQSA
ncbi:unnamed protein product, partial [Amoebophrya sp. A25]